MALRTRRAYYEAETGIRTDQIYPSSRLLSSITGVPVSPTKPVVGANAFAHEAGIHQHGVLSNALTYEIMTPSDIGFPRNTMVLGKHSGRHALNERLHAMGYQLSEKELDEVFIRFKALADTKKALTDSDIGTLVSAVRSVPGPETEEERR